MGSKNFMSPGYSGFYPLRRLGEAAAHPIAVSRIIPVQS
jgi:hypothetical protein